MTPKAMFILFLICHVHGVQQHLVRRDSSGWGTRRRYDNGIDFGGNMHKEEPHEGGTDPFKIRPELVKSEICTSSKCEDCTSQGGSGCWSGASSGVYDWTQVHVNANDPKDHYAFEVLASCASTTGSWILYPKEIVNADVKVYLDGVLQRTLQDADSGCSYNCYNKYGAAVGSPLGYGYSGSAVALNIPPGQKKRIRVALTPKASGSSARAKLGLFGRNFDEGVEQCMSTKECLSILGDGSAESFELRNSNRKQKECLNGESDSATCAKWKICLPDGQKKGLLSFLKASLRAGSLEEQGVVARSGKTSEVACMDPSSSDPESWACECVDMIIAACGSEDDEACMFNNMCAHAEVCSEWKTANGCGGALEENAAAMSTRSANISLLSTGLDNTLSGKCAE